MREHLAEDLGVHLTAHMIQDIDDTLNLGEDESDLTHGREKADDLQQEYRG
jgi:hypothetical protein